MKLMTQSELLEQAINHYEEGLIISALRMFNQYINEKPNDIVALQYIGESQRLLYMVDDALSTLSLVYKKTSGNEKACVAGRIAILLSGHRSLAEAESWYEKSMDCAKDYIDWIWVLRGTNLVNMGQPKDGIGLLEEAIKLGCENPDEAYVGISLAKRALGLYRDARQCSVMALQIDGENDIAKNIIREVDEYLRSE